MVPPNLFLFLAALSVACFAFLSIVVWVQGQSGERKARDRFALLKGLAESPGENAQRVLAYLREEEQGRLERRDTEERKGYKIGGLVCMACGVGFWFIVPNVLGVGLLIFLVGAALFPFGFGGRRSGGPDASGR
jgi:Flp pilus assembly protein TadB